MYLTGTYLICRKNQNQNIFYGFFAGRRMRAAKHKPANASSTIAGKHRQTKCRQKGTDGKTAIRHISAANNYPLRQHTSAGIIFLYREPNSRPAATSLPAPPAPAITLHQPYINHLTGSSRLLASFLRQLSPWHPVFRKFFQFRINFGFRLLHFAIQKCICIGQFFIRIRLLAIKHSHNLF